MIYVLFLLLVLFCVVLCVATLLHAAACPSCLVLSQYVVYVFLCDVRGGLQFIFFIFLLLMFLASIVVVVPNPVYFFVDVWFANLVYFSFTSVFSFVGI